jgi:hypothetical protein
MLEYSASSLQVKAIIQWLEMGRFKDLISFVFGGFGANMSVYLLIYA